MPQEKANELFKWKNKLEDLEHLPGEPLIDKGDAWQKLHKRLEQNPQSRKIAWYWIAAASLIGIIISMLWILPDNKKQDVVITHTQEPPVSPQAPDTTRIQEREKPIQEPIVVVQKPQSKQSQNSKHSSELRKSEPSIVTRTAIVDSLLIAKREIQVAIPQSVDTFSGVEPVPVKNKLSVVHINELEPSPHQRIEYAGTLSPDFRLKPGKRNRLSTVSLSRNSSDDIVKIKISPSN